MDDEEINKGDKSEIADMLLNEFDKKIQKNNNSSSHYSDGDRDDETLPYEFSIEKKKIGDTSLEVHSLMQSEPEDEFEHDETDDAEIIPEDELTASLTEEQRKMIGSIKSDEPEIKQQSEASYLDSYIEQTPKPQPSNDRFIVRADEDGDVLQKICATKLNHIERQKALIFEDKLRQKIFSMPAPRGFISRINQKIATGDNALIAEIKKASPSKGIIREDFEPGILAMQYSDGGATCISVLTDTPYFQGRDEYIDIVKRACDLPVLRKDFILDKYQVVESRALGADCILLIMAALTDEQAIELENEAIALGLDVLVEVHNEEEMHRALQLKTMLIGINNRNLKTLEIDLATTEKLVSMVPSPRTVVCESGIYSYTDIARINNSRVKAFLVGESLMSQKDVRLATQQLLGF